jgi:hypothetical protein
MPIVEVFLKEDVPLVRVALKIITDWGVVVKAAANVHPAKAAPLISTDMAVVGQVLATVLLVHCVMQALTCLGVV